MRGMEGNWSEGCCGLQTSPVLPPGLGPLSDTSESTRVGSYHPSRNNHSIFIREDNCLGLSVSMMDQRWINKHNFSSFDYPTLFILLSRMSFIAEILFRIMSFNILVKVILSYNTKLSQTLKSKLEKETRHFGTKPDTLFICQTPI